MKIFTCYIILKIKYFHKKIFKLIKLKKHKKYPKTCLLNIKKYFLIFDSPKDHPTITESGFCSIMTLRTKKRFSSSRHPKSFQEQEYIERSVPPPQKQISGKELISIYMKLCKSGGTWVYTFAMVGSSFLFYLILNLCPKYFKERLNLDLDQAGFLA